MFERTVNIILDSCVIASGAVAILISIIMILLMLFHRLVNKIDRTAHLLSINMYTSLLFGCLTVSNIYGFTLYGHIHVEISFDDRWCYLNAYLFYASGCAFFYSYLLQAIYRLCRIVFYMKPALQSSKLYIYGIVLQWLFSFLQVIPVLLLGLFKYLRADYHCQIPVDNLASLLIGLALVHLIPVALTTICYVYTAAYIRKVSRLTRSISQQTRNRRDFRILTRIFLLLFVIIISGIPTIGISLYTQFSGHLPYWSTQFQWLTATSSICLVSIILIFISPNLPRFAINP